MIQSAPNEAPVTQAPATVSPTSSPTSLPTLSPSLIQPEPTPVTSAVSVDFAAMETSFATLQKSLHGPAGIAIASGDQVWATGSKQVDWAWSTSKVPVAIAALQENPSARNRSLAQSAITVSSNYAAHALWETMGEYKKSAQIVTRTLVAGGDSNTTVNYANNNFGLTDWALKDSAVFADHLPCMPEAQTVYALMGKIQKSHSWGLGTISGTHFKGGWGPVRKGTIVRQIGVVPTSGSKFVGVAIMVESHRGQIRGQQDLTAIAKWLKGYLDEVPSRGCVAN